jgi:carboxylesterase type B
VAQTILETQEPMGEDCLLMDVVVPGEVVRGPVKDLSVLMWIYGGGYSMLSRIFCYYSVETNVQAQYLDRRTYSREIYLPRRQYNSVAY